MYIELNKVNGFHNLFKPDTFIFVILGAFVPWWQKKTSHQDSKTLRNTRNIHNKI